MVSAATSASPADFGCKGNPSVTGKCYLIQGQINLSADSGFVLWRDDGQGRPIKIRAAPNSDREWPSSLDRAMTRAWNETGSVTAPVRGIFEVCPIPVSFTHGLEEPYGCIQSVDHLATETPRTRK
jgi:hypothetical protein